MKSERECIDRPQWKLRDGWRWFSGRHESCHSRVLYFAALSASRDRGWINYGFVNDELARSYSIAAAYQRANDAAKYIPPRYPHFTSTVNYNTTAFMRLYADCHFLKTSTICAHIYESKNTAGIFFYKTIGVFNILLFLVSDCRGLHGIINTSFYILLNLYKRCPLIIRGVGNQRRISHALPPVTKYLMKTLVGTKHARNFHVAKQLRNYIVIKSYVVK